MRSRWILLVAGFACSIPAYTERPTVRGFTIPAKTSVPFTYCIHYVPNPEQESFLDEVRKSPPDLFHIGYHIPFKAALGPTYGHELFTNDILAPAGIPKEVERVQRLIGKMRSAGVDTLIPYVYTMAFFGHPDRRTGFFNFYDRWDDYRAFGLGPKPAADPSLWTQVVTPNQLGGGPTGELHYHPCVNHPGWLDFLDLVVRELGKVGYDGMFFDVNTQYCFCPHCQELFDIYLLEKYGRDGLKEVFGTNDHRELDISTIYRDFERFVLDEFKPYLESVWSKRIAKKIGLQNASETTLKDDWRLLRCFKQNSLGEYPPQDDLDGYLRERFGATKVASIPEEKRDSFVQIVLRHHFREFLKSERLAERLEERFGSSDLLRRCRTEPRDLLLWVETQRFWSRSMAKTHARLKGVGRVALADSGRGGDFFTVANLGGMATLDGLNKRRINGIDMTAWAPGSDLQMLEEMQQPGSLETGVILSNIFALRWAMAAGTRAGTLLYNAADNHSADLSQAEIAAGGGGAFIQLGTSAPESRRRWKTFFKEHAELWDNGDSCAKVALLFWSDQVYYEYTDHLASAHRFVNILAENQIPFDIVTEVDIERLHEYETVIAPRLRYLAPKQIATVTDYAKQGGNLVIVEPFGTEDEYARPRAGDPLLAVSPAGSGFQVRTWGAGKILRLDAKQIPPRRAEYWNLMEERGNVFSRAMYTMNQARRKEIENGVDLGSEFVERLERSFDTRLRWCPPETDSGVYIHPYRIPAKPGRPERLVVHAVNYRLPILPGGNWQEGPDAPPTAGSDSGEPVVAKNVSITVPLPRGASVKAIRTDSPTDEECAIPFERVENGIRISVPELKLYRALSIDLEM